MKRSYSIALAALGAVLAVPAVAAEAQGDARAGLSKAAMCQGCHGIEGYRIAFPEVYHVPKLGNQHAAYIVHALKDYRSGARNNATMRAIAGSLSDKDMADLAAYYAAGGK